MCEKRWHRSTQRFWSRDSHSSIQFYVSVINTTTHLQSWQHTSIHMQTHVDLHQTPPRIKGPFTTIRALQHTYFTSTRTSKLGHFMYMQRASSNVLCALRGWPSEGGAAFVATSNSFLLDARENVKTFCYSSHNKNTCARPRPGQQKAFGMKSRWVVCFAMNSPICMCMNINRGWWVRRVQQ